MFLRPNHRSKDGKEHTYWSLVESVRTPDGPRQRTLCHLGELNGSDQARWLRTVEVFNEHGEAQQLKLFPSQTWNRHQTIRKWHGFWSTRSVWKGRDSSEPAMWVWNSGDVWIWIVSSS